MYDALHRERLFTQAAERQQARWIPRRRQPVPPVTRSPDEPSSTQSDISAQALSGHTIADLAKILTEIHRRDDATVHGDLNSLDLSEEEKSRFRTRVNQWLVEHEREWNIHGISRTFRFWSEQEKRDYVGFADDVVQSLRDLTDNVCFGFGTVLAVVRDHDLIRHDDDADVIVGLEPSQAFNLADGRKLIRECLAEHGYTVTGKNRWAHHFVWRPTGGHKLDVFVGIFEQDNIAWYPGKRGALTRDMIFPPVYRTFLGHSCPIPRQPERYLEQIYGRDLQTPQPYFHHQWENARQEYRNIRGPHEPETRAPKTELHED